MLIHFSWHNHDYRADLSKPHDISLPMTPGADAVNAFYIPFVQSEPFRAGGFVGDVLQGGSCNVNTLVFNPHGNGTHTETVGHISKEKETIHEHLRQFFFMARLISVTPRSVFEDRIIQADQIAAALGEDHPEALIIRTYPNPESKRTRHYSGTNPPYLQHEAATWIRERGIRHLLLDLPSVDREDDGGKLSAHHAFWHYPEATRKDATITELIYVPDQLHDGWYLLNLQISSIMNDAAPSKPLLFSLIK